MSKSVVVFCLVVNFLYASCRPQDKQEPSQFQVDAKGNPLQNFVNVSNQLWQNIVGQEHKPNLVRFLCSFAGFFSDVWK